MRKLLTFLTVILMGFNLTGCAVAPGEVESVAEETTRLIVNRAAYCDQGAFTLRYMKSDIFMFAAYMKDTQSWGYTIVDVARGILALDQGQCVSCSSMADLLKNAVATGWDFVKEPWNVLPGAFYKSLDAATSPAWMAVPVLVLPGAAMDIPYQILPTAGVVE